MNHTCSIIDASSSLAACSVVTSFKFLVSSVDCFSSASSLSTCTSKQCAFIISTYICSTCINMLLITVFFLQAYTNVDTHSCEVCPCVDSHPAQGRQSDLASSVHLHTCILLGCRKSGSCRTKGAWLTCPCRDFNFISSALICSCRCSRMSACTRDRGFASSGSTGIRGWGGGEAAMQQQAFLLHTSKHWRAKAVLYTR